MFSCARELHLRLDDSPEYNLGDLIIIFSQAKFVAKVFYFCSVLT